MKIRETISDDFDFNKCYSGHDPEQHSRGFSRRSDILGNANVDGSVIFKPDIITRKVLNENELNYSVLESSRDKL